MPKKTLKTSIFVLNRVLKDYKTRFSTLTDLFSFEAEW
jgi:hypothetical protein